MKILLLNGSPRPNGNTAAALDEMEAVFAAVYLDGGFDQAVAVVRRALGDDLRPEGLEDHLDELEGPAERWATERGGRSPRCARQFIDDAEARIRRGEPLR